MRILKYILVFVLILTLFTGCDNDIITSIIPTTSSSQHPSIDSTSLISINVNDTHGKPLVNAWYKSYCTNQNGNVEILKSDIGKDGMLKFKVYNPVEDILPYTATVDTALDIANISTDLTCVGNEELSPRIGIQVKALDADSIYVKCYSQEQNRPQTTGFVYKKRITGKCMFNDTPYHEGYVNKDGIFNVACVQKGKHFAEVTVFRGTEQTTQYFNFVVDDLTKETKFIADMRSVATGYSLDELGYTTDFSAVRIRDKNNPSKKNVAIEAVGNTTLATQSNNTILKGSSTSINVTLYNSDHNKTSEIPVMLLQGFKKSEYKQYKYIEAGSSLYSISELELYKVFEDDNNIIYDMRFPSTELDLTQLPEPVDTQAILNLYYRLNKTSFIKPVVKK